MESSKNFAAMDSFIFLEKNSARGRLFSELCFNKYLILLIILYQKTVASLISCQHDEE